MLNLCGIVVAIFKMASARNCSMSEINSGHHNLPTYQSQMISDNVEFVAIILKMAIGRNFSMSGHHYLPTYQILMISDNVEFLPPIFLCRVLAAILKKFKMQNCSSNGDLSLCHILCLIIHLEISTFPQDSIVTPTPFTTKLKTLGPTRNIHL